MLDVSNVLEMQLIRDAEAFHAKGVSPLLEVLLEGSSAPVTCTSADFAFKLLAETVQLVQPVRNRLTIPTHGQVFRVVLYSVFVTVLSRDSNCFSQDVFSFKRFFFSFNFLIAAGLLFAHLVHGLSQNIN